MNTIQMDALQRTTRALADMVFYERFTLISNKCDDEQIEHFRNAYRALVTAASELRTISNQYQRMNNRKN